MKKSTIFALCLTVLSTSLLTVMDIFNALKKYTAGTIAGITSLASAIVGLIIIYKDCKEKEHDR